MSSTYQPHCWMQYDIASKTCPNLHSSHRKNVAIHVLRFNCHSIKRLPRYYIETVDGCVPPLCKATCGKLYKFSSDTSQCGHGYVLYGNVSHCTSFCREHVHADTCRTVCLFIEHMSTTTQVIVYEIYFDMSMLTPVLQIFSLYTCQLFAPFVRYKFLMYMSPR